MKIIKDRGQSNKPTDKLTYISDESYFEGNLVSKENLCIYGHFKGTIECHGRVIVGESGKVEADIFGSDIVISGKVMGNVSAENTLEITSTGVVKGDIKSVRMIMENGSKFDGHCEMPIGADIDMIEKVETPEMLPAREA